MDTPEQPNGTNGNNGDNESYAARLARELEQVKKDNEALKQEMHQQALDNSDDDLDTIRACFKPHIPQAITNIILLAEAAESESVRLSASKYIIEYGPNNAGNDDEFRSFLNKIKAKPFTEKERRTSE